MPYIETFRMSVMTAFTFMTTGFPVAFAKARWKLRSAWAKARASFLCPSMARKAFQLLYLRVSRALYHEGHDSLLHDLPVFEDVKDVQRVEGEHGKKGIEEDLPGVFAHVRAPAVPCLQQPEGRQHMQGLPDRDAAHSERHGKGVLRGDLCAGQPSPLHDLVPELLENLILHAGALHAG
jgi:hypothetical protein